MNAAQLFVLARKLLLLAESGLPQSGVSTSVRLVLVDIAYHPGSSITEITARTGFPQSHVSASVAKLRDVGAVETSTDPSDRRRTLVRATPAAIEAGARVGLVPVEEILGRELPDDRAGDVAQAVAALELLVRLLAPEVLGQAAPR